MNVAKLLKSFYHFPKYVIACIDGPAYAGGFGLACCSDFIFATKNLERAGDHVTNIAETICYLIKGEYLKGSRPKGKQAQE